MTANATMISSSSTPPPNSTSSSTSSHWDRLPTEIRDMIFEYVDIPSELRIQVHHFKPKKQMKDGSRIKYAVEIKNKDQWRDMLRFQAIKEIDAAIIQPLLTAKKIIIKLDIAGHPNECDVWEGNVPGFTPGRKDCVRNWPAFLKKFPFKRMQTVAPYILRQLNAAKDLRDLPTEELHYLQLTYDEGEPAAWQEEDDILPWAVKKYQWKTVQDSDIMHDQTLAIYDAVEYRFYSVAQHFFQLGLSAEDMGRLQERLAVMPLKVYTKDFQLGSWSAGLMYASGLMSSSLGIITAWHEIRSMPLEDVVWEKVED